MKFPIFITAFLLSSYSFAQKLALELDAPAYEIPSIRNNKYSKDLEQNFSFISDMRLMYYPGSMMMFGIGLRFYGSERMSEYGDNRNYKFIADKLNELGEEELQDLLLYNWVENRIGLVLRMDVEMASGTKMVLGGSSGWMYAPGNLMKFNTVDNTEFVEQVWGKNKGWFTDFEIGFLHAFNKYPDLQWGMVYEFHYGNVNLNYSIEQRRSNDGTLINSFPVSKDFEILRHGVSLKFQATLRYF